MQLREARSAIALFLRLWGTPIEFAQFLFRGFKPRTAALRKLVSGPIDVKGEHGHRGPKGIALSAMTPVGGALERTCNTTRIALGKHAVLKVQSIAFFCDSRRPALFGLRHEMASVCLWLHPAKF